MPGMNKQNPDRGIETTAALVGPAPGRSMNKQNPDRGIETLTNDTMSEVKASYEQTESRPRD